MRSLLTTCAALGAIVLTGCHGALNGANNLAEIDVTQGPVYLDEYGIDGGMYKMAFDQVGSPFNFASTSCLGGYNAGSGANTWFATTICIEEMIDVGSGPSSTTAGVLSIKPGTNQETLIIGNIRDASNDDCVDWDEDGVVDPDLGEDWENDNCWLRMNNYQRSPWVVSDIDDVNGYQGAQLSVLVVAGQGLYEGETSI